jgi:hypothetical protein
MGVQLMAEALYRPRPSRWPGLDCLRAPIVIGGAGQGRSEEAGVAAGHINLERRGSN